MSCIDIWMNAFLLIRRFKFLWVYSLLWQLNSIIPSIMLWKRQYNIVEEVVDDVAAPALHGDQYFLLAKIFCREKGESMQQKAHHLWCWDAHKWFWELVWHTFSPPFDPHHNFIPTTLSPSQLYFHHNFISTWTAFASMEITMSWGTQAWVGCCMQRYTSWWMNTMVYKLVNVCNGIQVGCCMQWYTSWLQWNGEQAWDGEHLHTCNTGIPAKRCVLAAGNDNAARVWWDTVSSFSHVVKSELQSTWI